MKSNLRYCLSSVRITKTPKPNGRTYACIDVEKGKHVFTVNRITNWSSDYESPHEDFLKS